MTATEIPISTPAPTPGPTTPIPTTELMGMSLAAIDRWQLVDVMFDAMRRGQGGWLVTANLDFLRRWVHDPAVRSLYGAADLRVADGMPLVWAASLLGTPLPERVPGSSIIYLLAGRAALEGRRIYLLGGDPGAAEGARTVLERHYPGLSVCGCACPWFSVPPTDEEIADAADDLARARPDLVLVGLGSPKQEYVIRALRGHLGDTLPATWWMGVGITFSFVAGIVRRAPPALRRAGLEWVHRLAQEPGRLGRRYLVEDLPFAIRLLASTFVKGRLDRPRAGH